MRTQQVCYINGRMYYKLDQDDTIKKGCLHSYNGGELLPIVHSGSIGQHPSDFSPKREFFNPADEIVIPK
jgi:hypothetical protein